MSAPPRLRATARRHLVPPRSVKLHLGPWIPQILAAANVATTGSRDRNECSQFGGTIVTSDAGVSPKKHCATSVFIATIELGVRGAGAS